MIEINKPAMLPVVGGTYKTRVYPNLKDSDLKKVKVLAIEQLGDGKTVVTYKSASFWIPGKETFYLDEWFANVVVADLSSRTDVQS